MKRQPVFDDDGNLLNGEKTSETPAPKKERAPRAPRQRAECPRAEHRPAEEQRPVKEVAPRPKLTKTDKRAAARNLLLEAMF